MEARESCVKLVNAYFTSWLTQDIETFSSVLDRDVLIYECYGEVYEDKGQAMEWFKEWHHQGHRVTKWDITEMYFDESKPTVIVEWHFECRCEEKDYSFLGCSTIQFTKGKIGSIKEYKMEFEKKYPCRNPIELCPVERA